MGSLQIEPPAGWSNDYEQMGGDMVWGPDGEVSELTRGCDIEGPIKPVFAMEAWTGEAISLFEAGDGKFFLFNPIEGSIFQIDGLNDLESIVPIIGDEDRGLAALPISQIC